MAILGSGEIRRRLENNEIFVPRTWKESCIDAASYDLRIAPDGMFVGGIWREIGDSMERNDTIYIDEGEMVILSTIEKFIMPLDLVGSVNIKFSYARKGLISLFGSRMDPGYGQDLRTEDKRGEHGDSEYKGQRLWITIANIGFEKIPITPGARILMVEFHEVKGDVSPQPRKNIDQSMQKLLSKLSDQKSKLSFLQGARSEINDLKEKVEWSIALKKETKAYRIITWGVTALIGVSIFSVLFSIYLMNKSTSNPKIESSVAIQQAEGIIGYIADVPDGIISVSLTSTSSRLSSREIVKITRVIQSKDLSSPILEKYIGLAQIVSINGNDAQLKPIGEIDYKLLREGDIISSIR